MRVDESRLKEFIVDLGLASDKEMAIAREKALEKNVSLEEVLLSNGVVGASDLSRIRAYMLGLSYVDLGGRNLDFQTLSIIPEPVSRVHNVVAFNNIGGVVEVALLDIKDLPAIDFIKKTGLKIRPHLTDNESMKDALVVYQTRLKEKFGDSIQKEIENARVEHIVDSLLRHALVQSASDIHIESGESHALVRYRIAGLLREAMALPKNIFSGIADYLKSLAGFSSKEDGLPQTGRFRAEIEGENLTLSVSILPTVQGEKLTLRIVRGASSGFTIESLGFGEDDAEELHRIMTSGSGLILAAGPQGSGKTTTLYTLLDILNTPERSVYTVENPVEYRMSRVHQVELRPEIGLTSGHALRSILRHHPDVVMLGEIDSAETAALALSAARAGSLLLTSAKASSAEEALDYLKKLGMDGISLASNLRAVVTHNLTRDQEGNYRGNHKLVKPGDLLQL